MRKFFVFSTVISLFIFLKLNWDKNKFEINLKKNINEVKIININNLSEEYILKSINIYEGQSFWSFNSKKLKNDLQKINEIQDFNYKLSPSGILTISINEKKPFMIFKKGNDSIFLDDQAEPLNFSKKFSSNIIKFNGYYDKDKLKKFNNILMKNEILKSDIQEFFYLKNIGWKIIFFNKKCLYLPEEKINKVLGEYKKIRHSKFYNEYNYFDMRILERIYLNKKNLCLNS